MADTWRLVDERVSMIRVTSRDQALIQRLGRAINAILKRNRRRRTEEAGEDIEKLLGVEPPLHKESWHQMKGWYKAVVNHVPPSDWVTLERLTEECVDIYRHVSPPGENIPVSVETFQVEESVPTKDEIEWEVK